MVYLVDERALFGVAIYRAPVCITVNRNAIVIIFSSLPMYAVRKAGLCGVGSCLYSRVRVVFSTD